MQWPVYSVNHIFRIGAFSLERGGFSPVVRAFRVADTKPVGGQPTNPTTGVRVERRAAVRVPVRVAVSLMCIDRKVYGWVANISAGGLFVQADELFPIGSRVLVDALLAMDNAVHHLKVEGRVAHTHGGGMGIEFVKPESESVLFIRRLVTRMLFHEGH